MYYNGPYSMAFPEMFRQSKTVVHPRCTATGLDPNTYYFRNTLTPGSIPGPLNFPSLTPPSRRHPYCGPYMQATESRAHQNYDDKIKEAAQLIFNERNTTVQEYINSSITNLENFKIAEVALESVDLSQIASTSSTEAIPSPLNFPSLTPPSRRHPYCGQYMQATEPRAHQNYDDKIKEAAQLIFNERNTTVQEFINSSITNLENFKIAEVALESVDLSQIANTSSTEANTVESCDPKLCASRIQPSTQIDILKYSMLESGILPMEQIATSDSNTPSSGKNETSDNEYTFEKVSVLKRHKMLSAAATDVLSKWYRDHEDYPYPDRRQVLDLAEATQSSTKQVTKWMANQRVLCYNTLSIRGHENPRKKTHQEQSRQLKVPDADKKNTHSQMSSIHTKSILNQWFDVHIQNPYPSAEEKLALAMTCDISIQQVNSWFANKRNRTNNNKRQVPNYFLQNHPEHSHLVQAIGEKREEERLAKRKRLQ